MLDHPHALLYRGYVCTCESNPQARSSYALTNPKHLGQPAPQSNYINTQEPPSTHQDQGLLEQ